MIYFEYFEPTEPFELHQVYEAKGSVEQIRCSRCGQTKLEVGQGGYFTMIRCQNCKAEECIHDG